MEESVFNLEHIALAESPKTVHGRVLEAAHISGYSFERLCANLEWLLEDERWKQVDGGIDDPSKFLATIDLSPFRMEASQRKRLAKLLTETLEASQRATARALGVHESTVRADLGKRAGNPAPHELEPASVVAIEDANAGNPASPPTSISGRWAAQEIEKKHKATATREAKRSEILAQLEAVETKENKAVLGVADVVVIDPPWPIEKIERDERPNQVEFDYPSMDESEIGNYIETRAPFADDCHIWLWATHRFLPSAFRLLDRWGLKYVCAFTWHKPGGFQPINLPQYNCEFALYARKGSPIFRETVAFPVCFSAGREDHSSKPLEFYSMVRRVTPGRRLDIFNRREIPGFEGEGKEAV